MRVVVGERMGGPEVLAVAEREAPRPGPGEVVVEVAAAGVNYMDIYQREGVGNYRTEPPFVPGAEGAGTVVAVGSDVKDLSVGDHVAWAGQGSSYAEQVALPANRVVPVPDGMNLQVAAAAILQGMTAHYLCTSTYPVREGDITVVHAAAGGVGLLLTQMVKRRGGLVVGPPRADRRSSSRSRPAPITSLAMTASATSSTRPVTVPGRTSCTTAWARTPSTTAWRRCARAA